MDVWLLPRFPVPIVLYILMWLHDHLCQPRSLIKKVGNLSFRTVDHFSGFPSLKRLGPKKNVVSFHKKKRPALNRSALGQVQGKIREKPQELKSETDSQDSQDLEEDDAESPDELQSQV